MKRILRYRCPHCGLCYETKPGELIEKIACQNCGENIVLVQENPDGILNGNLPPPLRFVAAGSAALFFLLAIYYWVFSILGFIAFALLLVETIMAYRKQRSDRIFLFNLLRDAHAKLKGENGTILRDLESTRHELAEQIDKYNQIDPVRRDGLANEIIEQQLILGAFQTIKELKIEEDRLKVIIENLRKRIISFEDEELYQSFSFYKPLYDCGDSAAYMKLLDEIRAKQKNLIRDKKAVHCNPVLEMASDKQTAKKQARSLEKLILRSFNSECDATIDNVTFSNIDSIRARIGKAYDDLNELCQVVGVSLTQAYLQAKLEELHAFYEYQLKIKDEREEQRKIREQMREQAKVFKEIEDAKAKIEKDERLFNNTIAEIKARMEAASELERKQYEEKLKELEGKLAVVQKDKEEVLYREKSTRAGHVYIISNIGSFGENVYKIGVTCRLDPNERIDELGSASVPFDFDIHAMIFSDDAFMLEAKLHQEFADRAVNKMNHRKEYFRASLPEIADLVRKNHDKIVEFTMLAKAEDFRLTQAKERSTKDVAAEIRT